MKTAYPNRSSNHGKRGSTLLSVLTLVMVLFFVALIALQVMEFTHYGAEPSVWPAR